MPQPCPNSALPGKTGLAIDFQGIVKRTRNDEEHSGMFTQPLSQPYQNRDASEANRNNGRERCAGAAPPPRR